MQHKLDKMNKHFTSLNDIIDLLIQDKAYAMAMEKFKSSADKVEESLETMLEV